MMSPVKFKVVESLICVDLKSASSGYQVPPLLTVTVDDGRSSEYDYGD